MRRILKIWLFFFGYEVVFINISEFCRIGFVFGVWVCWLVVFLLNRGLLIGFIMECFNFDVWMVLLGFDVINWDGVWFEIVCLICFSWMLFCFKFGIFVILLLVILLLEVVGRWRFVFCKYGLYFIVLFCICFDM